MPLPDYEGKAKANVFFVAYTREGAPPEPAAGSGTGASSGSGAAPQPAGAGLPAAPPAAAGQPGGAGGLDVGLRPITFAFNGGPGSSSVWLHLGTLGPRR